MRFGGLLTCVFAAALTAAGCSSMSGREPRASRPPAIAATTAAVRPFRGNVILARDGAQAIYLWDATAYVTQLVSDRKLGESGLRALEASAVLALRNKAVSSHAQVVTLQVFYSKTGAVSPVYQTATFTGVEPVCTVTAKPADLVRSGALWARNVADGRLPKRLSIRATGKLPPR